MITYGNGATNWGRGNYVYGQIPGMQLLTDTDKANISLMLDRMVQSGLIIPPATRANDDRPD